MGDFALSFFDKLSTYLKDKKERVLNEFQAIRGNDYILPLDMNMDKYSGINEKTECKVRAFILHDYVFDTNDSYGYNYVIGVDKSNLTSSDYIKCFIKKTNDCPDRESERIVSYQTAEILGSQLAGVMGLRVPYNFKFKDTYDYVVSLNFLQDNEKFISFYKILGDNMVDTLKLDSWLQALETFCRRQFTDECVSNDILTSLVKDVIKTYIIKFLVIGDTDLHTGNVGFVFTQHNMLDIRVSPAFDFEYAFGGIAYDGMLETPSNSSIINDLSKVIKKYPGQIAEVIDELNRSGLKALIGKVINNNIMDDAKSQKVYDYITSRIDRVNYLYSKSCEQAKFDCLLNM